MLKTLFKPEESANTNKVWWTPIGRLVGCVSERWCHWDVSSPETLHAAALRGVAMETGRPSIWPLSPLRWRSFKEVGELTAASDWARLLFSSYVCITGASDISLLIGWANFLFDWSSCRRHKKLFFLLFRRQKSLDNQRRHLTSMTAAQSCPPTRITSRTGLLTMHSLTGSVRASVTVHSGTHSTDAGFLTTLFSNDKWGHRTHRTGASCCFPTSAASSDQEPEDLQQSVE